MTYDAINSILLSCASLFVWWNVYRLWCDKKARGTSRVTAFYFFVLAAWQILYFYHLHQPNSVWGEIPVMLACAAYFGFLIYYTLTEKAHVS